MNNSFDLRKIQGQVEKVACEAYMKAIERAKLVLGNEGEGIIIKRRPATVREGTTLNFGDISFPNADIKRQFEEALRRELR